MIYSKEIENMCPVHKGADHGPAPIPEEGKWVKSKEISDISGLTHGIGWCAPQQGCCKLTLNVKEGIIEEALVETIGCSGMTHSAAMAGEILVGKTILEALNTDLVCDAINTAMREQVGTIYSTKVKGPRYLELTEGYITEIALDEDDEIIGYKYINVGVMLDLIKDGVDPMEAIEKASGQYGRFDDAVKTIDPRKEQEELL